MMTLEERAAAFRLWMIEGEKRYGITVIATKDEEQLGEAVLVRPPKVVLSPIAGWQAPPDTSEEQPA